MEARIAEEAKKKKRKAERKAQRDLELGIVRVWVENVEERGDQSIRFLTTETLTRRITVENRGEQDKRLMAEQAYARRATL